MTQTTNADRKKFTVILEKDIYESVEKAAGSRHRSVSGEAGMALTTIYGEDPYLMDRLTGIAISQGINPAVFLKELIDDYEYNRIKKERSLKGRK